MFENRGLVKLKKFILAHDIKKSAEPFYILEDEVILIVSAVYTGFNHIVTFMHEEKLLKTKIPYSYHYSEDELFHNYFDLLKEA